MASMKTLTRDITMRIRAHNPIWTWDTSSPLVTASVDAAGMLSVSIANTTVYSDYKVTVTATDSRGAALSEEVIVRRNRKPTVGTKAVSTDIIWVGTQMGKNTQDIEIAVKGSDCTTDCDFGDDDMVTFDVVSGNMRQVTGAHKEAGKITVMGLASSWMDTRTDTTTDLAATDYEEEDFQSVYLAVRAKDTGNTYSSYRERFVHVKVNQAPMQKANAFLPALALDFGQSTAPPGTVVDEIPDDIAINELKAVFEDKDALSLDDHTITVVSKTPRVASVSRVPATGDITHWRINAVGPGEAIIEVTLKEPPRAPANVAEAQTNQNITLGQSAKQTFTVTVRDSGSN